MKILQKVAIERPITTSMFFLFLILLGLISFSDLEINLLPNMEFPRLTIITKFQNASPEEVENLITKPISETVGTIKGLEKITSESLEGTSFVTLQFSWSTKIDFAAMEVREKVDLIRGVLPEDASKPLVSKFDPSQSPIIQVVFYPQEKTSIKDLRSFLKKEIKGYLDRIDGVALAQFSGGFQKEIQIEIDPISMHAHGISLKSIQEVIEASNINYPAGHITEGEKSVLIRTLGEYTKTYQIGETKITQNKGIPIKINAFANVYDGFKERKGLALYNGQEAVIVSIFKESGKNSIKVSQSVREELEKIKETFSDRINFDIVFDESLFVKDSIENITGGLISGGILAFLSLVIVLRNFKSPVILLTVLPISIITTFLLMYLKNLTLNVMTLGGLSLGIGMLFDSGNVVLSAIERNIQKGMHPKEASIQGSLEVAGSITSAVLTTIIIFLPIIFLKGVIGVVFGEMALTITISLTVSLIVSLTLIPMMSSFRKPGQELQTFKSFQKIEKLEAKLDKSYVKVISQLIIHPRRILILTGCIFVIIFFYFPKVDREFIPKVDTGQFNIEILNEKGSTLESTKEIASFIEGILLKEPETEHIITLVGFNEDQSMIRTGGEIGTHQAQMKVILKKSRNIKTKNFISQIRKKIKLRDGIRINFQPEEDILAKILSPDAKGINLEIEGNDLTTLSHIGNIIKSDLEKIPGIVDLKTSIQEKNREYQINFEEDKLAAFGISHAYLSGIIKSAIGGTVVTRLRVSDQEIDVRIRFKESYRNNKNLIENMLVELPNGESTKLNQITQFKEGKGYSSILKVGQARINKISGNIENEKQKVILDQIEKYIMRLNLPEGYKVRFGGEKENIDKSTKELLFAFLFAIALIYMLLAGQFESFLIPLIMLLTIPLIFIGIVPTLLLTNHSFNVSSFTGIILLVGIVVDNAALFYEYIEILRPDFETLKETIIESGQIVLRPIILNNGTTLLGLLPVALEIGEGTEFQSPMAVTVISGLLASVALSLFIIPIAFYYLILWKEKRSSLKVLSGTR